MCIAVVLVILLFSWNTGAATCDDCWGRGRLQNTGTDTASCTCQCQTAGEPANSSVALVRVLNATTVAAKAMLLMPPTCRYLEVEVVTVRATLSFAATAFISPHFTAGLIRGLNLKFADQITVSVVEALNSVTCAVTFTIRDDGSGNDFQPPVTALGAAVDLDFKNLVDAAAVADSWPSQLGILSVIRVYPQAAPSAALSFAHFYVAGYQIEFETCLWLFSAMVLTFLLCCADLIFSTNFVIDGQESAFELANPQAMKDAAKAAKGSYETLAEYKFGENGVNSTPPAKVAQGTPPVSHPTDDDAGIRRSSAFDNYLDDDSIPAADPAQQVDNRPRRTYTVDGMSQAPKKKKSFVYV